MASRAEPSPATVVLLAIDGVRYREVFSGVHAGLARAQNIPEHKIVDAPQLVPSLHGLLTRGAALGAPGVGDELSASGPHFVSLPGYIEMLSGRSPSGCLGNDCDRPAHTTLLDAIARCEPGAPEVGVVSSWPTLERATGRVDNCATVSSGRNKGRRLEALRYDEAARDLLELPSWVKRSQGNLRPDRITAEIALRYLEQRVPRFLFVGLGETDEHAHHNRYEAYLDALVYADTVIARISEMLHALEGRGIPTALFVTTDHGRSNLFVAHGEKYPESARVWLFAAGSMIGARGIVPLSRPTTLGSVASSIGHLLSIPETPEQQRVLWELQLQPASDGVPLPRGPATRPH